MSTPAFRSPLAVAVVGFLALAALLSALVGPPGLDRPPPDGSTESTSPGGLAAAAELLEAVGRQVIVTQGELPEVLPEHRGATHFIMDGGTVFRADRDALQDALAAGDRLVIANVVPSYLVRRAPQSRVAAVERGQLAFPHADFAGAVDIRTDGSRVWQTTGTMLPLVNAGDATLVAITAGADGGEVVGLSDDVLISNEALRSAGNAELLIALAGDAQTVAFHETGFALPAEIGYAALGSSWRWALAILVLAGVVFLASRAKRFGPIAEAAFERPPPRSAYVGALAGILQKGRTGGAAAAQARKVIRRRLRVLAGADGSDPALVAVAVRHGIDENEARLALSDGDSEEHLMAAARLLARLQH